MEFGLLLLRAVVGLLMAAHGAQKLFGWFDGHGIEGTGGFLESLGWRPGRPFAVLLGAAELLGGLALALGFATPVAAALLAGVLANAAWTVHRRNGLWNTEGGYEFPLTLAAAALALAFTGAGALSLDAALGWALAGTGWGLTALALGALGWLLGVGACTMLPRWSTGHRTPTTPKVA
jgi:putative oxidoreductase